MDRISIDDITCYAYHGVLHEERNLGQEFQVSLELGTDFSRAKNDSIERAVDYRQAVKIVTDIMWGEPCQLLETIAEKIAAQLLQLPGVMEAEVEIRKPYPPIPEVKGGVGVLISRRK